jgi:hypothetical protein
MGISEMRFLQYVCQHSLLRQYDDAKLLKIPRTFGIPGKFLFFSRKFNIFCCQQAWETEKFNQDNFLDLTDTKQKRVN